MVAVIPVNSDSLIISLKTLFVTQKKRATLVARLPDLFTHLLNKYQPPNSK